MKVPQENLSSALRSSLQYTRNIVKLRVIFHIKRQNSNPREDPEIVPVMSYSTHHACKYFEL